MAIEKAPSKPKRWVILQRKKQGRVLRTADSFKEGQLHLRQVIEPIVEHGLQRLEKRSGRNERDEGLGQIVLRPNPEGLASFLHGRIERQERAEPLPIVILEIAFTETFQRLRSIDRGILQVANGRPERAPRPRGLSDSLQRSLAGELAVNNVTNELFKEQLVNDPRQWVVDLYVPSQP